MIIIEVDECRSKVLWCRVYYTIIVATIPTELFTKIRMYSLDSGDVTSNLEHYVDRAMQVT